MRRIQILRFQHFGPKFSVCSSFRKQKKVINNDMMLLRGKHIAYNKFLTSNTKRIQIYGTIYFIHHLHPLLSHILIFHTLGWY